MSDMRPSNPRWANAERTAIIVDVVLFGQPDTFTATPGDVEPYGRAIFESAKAGRFGLVAPFQTGT